MDKHVSSYVDTNLIIKIFSAIMLPCSQTAPPQQGDLAYMNYGQLTGRLTTQVNSCKQQVRSQI